MSNHIPNNSPVESRPFLFDPTSQAEHSGKKGMKSLDTIAAVQADEKEKKGKKIQDLTSGRIELPPPIGRTRGKAPPDYLMILAEAFSKAFTSMADSTIEQTKGYVQLQKLDTTMAHSVLDTQNIAIAKEKKAIDTAARLEAKEKKEAKTEKILDYTMLAVGLAIMVVVIGATIASGFGDGGLSEAAVPEEVELTVDFGVAESGAAAAAGSDAAADGAATSGTEAAEAGSTSSDSAGATTTSETTASEGATVESQSSFTQSEVNSDAQSEEVEEESGKANEQASKSNSSWRAKISKFLAKTSTRLVGGTMIGAVLGSPMLVTGIYDLLQSKENYDLASIQESAGAAASTLQTNNAYFRFYQQLVKREGSVLQEEGQNASEVVDTFSSITKAYRQINYGLANAV